MTRDPFTTIKPQIARDRWQRPLVIPPTGGKAIGYTRASTLGAVLEDTSSLTKWKQRMTAIGMTERQDLATAVAAHRDDKREMDRLCEAAMEAAGASAGATTGTALHALADAHDRGDTRRAMPGPAAADLDAYATATAGLTAVGIEEFVVCDALQAAGTFDRLWQLPDGEIVVGDLKTQQSMNFGALKMAVQLAVYANGHRPTLTDGEPAGPEREPLGASLTRGLIVHLPSGQARCDLYWIDLVAGLEAANLAVTIRNWRKKQVLERADMTARTITAQDLTDLIHAAPTYPDLLALHAQHRDVWGDVHTLQAGQRRKEVEAA